MRRIVVVFTVIALIVGGLANEVAAQRNKPKDRGSKAAVETLSGDVGKNLDAFLRSVDSDAGGFCGSAIVASAS